MNCNFHLIFKESAGEGSGVARFPRVPSFSTHTSPSSFKPVLYSFLLAFSKSNLKSHLALENQTNKNYSKKLPNEKKDEANVNIVPGNTAEGYKTMLELVSWYCAFAHPFCLSQTKSYKIMFIGNFTGPFDRIYFHRQLKDFVITGLYFWYFTEANNAPWGYP